MPRKLPITLKQYVDQLQNYRLEFLKRSKEYIALKDIEREKWGQFYEHDDLDEFLDEILLHRVIVFLPDNTGKIDNGTLEADPPPPLEFLFNINPYSSFDEFSVALKKFTATVTRVFKYAKKHGYAGTQTSYILDTKGSIDYFRISGEKPFSLWERYLQAYDLNQKKYSNTKIGTCLNKLYGGIEGTALIRSVSNDLTEVSRLISCAKYPYFPYNPPTEDDHLIIHPPKNLQVSKGVRETFQNKITEPLTQEIISKFKMTATPRTPFNK